jgi:hypothetical protein
VAAVGIAAELALTAVCKKALQSASGETSVAQLSGGATGRGEALDRVTVALCALPNGFQSGGLRRIGPDIGELVVVVDRLNIEGSFIRLERVVKLESQRVSALVLIHRRSNVRFKCGDLLAGLLKLDHGNILSRSVGRNDVRRVGRLDDDLEVWVAFLVRDVG